MCPCPPSLSIASLRELSTGEEGVQECSGAVVGGERDESIDAAGKVVLLM